MKGQTGRGAEILAELGFADIEASGQGVRGQIRFRVFHDVVHQLLHIMRGGIRGRQLRRRQCIDLIQQCGKKSGTNRLRGTLLPETAHIGEKISRRFHLRFHL